MKELLFSIIIINILQSDIANGQNNNSDFDDFINSFQNTEVILSSDIYFDSLPKRDLRETYIQEKYVEEFICDYKNSCFYNEHEVINYHYEYLIFENDMLLLCTYIEIQYLSAFKRIMVVVSKNEKKIINKILLDESDFGNYSFISVFNNFQIESYMVSRSSENEYDFAYRSVRSDIDTIKGLVNITKSEWKYCSLTFKKPKDERFFVSDINNKSVCK